MLAFSKVWEKLPRKAEDRLLSGPTFPPFHVVRKPPPGASLSLLIAQLIQTRAEGPVREPRLDPTLSEGTLDPAPILFCISRMTDTHVYKGLSRRDSTLSPSPPRRVEGLLLEMIKS